MAPGWLRRLDAEPTTPCIAPTPAHFRSIVTGLRTGYGIEESGKDEAGKDEAGKDEAGKDEAGKDEPGKDQAGKDQAGKDQAGKDQALTVS
jgi:hypothetical protein